ncbi:MAG: MFS transporter [Microbacteriaceae bacterium]
MRLVPVAYLSSYVLSLLGNSIAAIALPLLILQLTGSALSAGILAAATAIPAVIAGVGMGVVIDRINRRTSSVVTDLISAAAIAALPLVDLVSDLNLGWFILFGVLGSLGDVPGMTARETLLPAVVRASGMSAERLIGLREALGAVAVLAGPAAAGGLMILLDGSTVLWVTAGTSFVAALITLLIPHRVGAVSPRDAATSTTPSVRRELKEGLVLLFRTSPFLRTMTLVNLIMVVVIAGLQGLVLPFHFTAIGEPGLVGFVLSGIAAGTLVGGALYALLGTRGPRRAWFITGISGMAVGIAIICLLPPMPVMLTGAVVAGAFSGLVGSLLGVLFLERIPDRMRGRVLGTQNAIMTLAPSLGIVIAAVITEYWTVGSAGIVFAAVWALAAIGALVAPALRDLSRESAVDQAPPAAADDADPAAASRTTCTDPEPAREQQ